MSDTSDQSELVISPLRSPLWGWFFMLMGAFVILGGFWIFAAMGKLQLELLRRKSAKLIEQADGIRDEAVRQKLQATAHDLDAYVASHDNENIGAKDRLSLQYGILPIGLMLILLGKRLRQPDPMKLLLKDKRKPVLYLRSFKDDKSTINVGQVTSATEESKFVRQLRAIGPVLAIGRPGEMLPQVGAARLYIGRTPWTKVAVQLMEQAELIVLRAGTTEGLLWEIGRIREEIQPSHFALYVPENVNYAEFKAKAEERLKSGLPEKLHGCRLILFNGEWKPIPVYALKNPASTFAPRRSFSFRRDEIKELKSAFQRPQPPPPTGRSLLELLSKLELETVKRPAFHLHLFSWIMALGTFALILLFPSNTVKFMATTEVLFPGHAGLAASLVECLGLFTAALALSFLPYLSKPSRRKWPNLAFVGVLSIDLVFLALRIPEARKEARSIRRLQEAKAGLKDAKAFQALVQQWLSEGAAKSAEDDPSALVARLDSLISLLDNFAPQVGPESKQMVERFSSLAREFKPAAVEFANAQKRYFEKGGLDKLHTTSSVADLDNQISLLDDFRARLKAFQDARTKFMRELSAALLAGSESPQDVTARKQVWDKKIKEKGLDRLQTLEDTTLNLLRESMVFLRDHWGKWQVNSNGQFVFTDQSQKVFDSLQKSLEQAAGEYDLYQKRNLNANKGP